jgi:hypothetical protein
MKEAHFRAGIFVQNAASVPVGLGRDEFLVKQFRDNEFV